jgi:hypothetical protein
MLAIGDGIAVSGICLAALGALHTVLKFRLDTADNSTVAREAVMLTSGEGGQFVSRDLCEEREKHINQRLTDLSVELKEIRCKVVELTNMFLKSYAAAQLEGKK